MQFSSFLFFNLGFFGFPALPLVLPVLYSLGAPNKTVGEAFGMIQWLLSELVFPWIPLASILLAAAISGRLLCGWVCPFGFIQDAWGYVKKKKIPVSLTTHRELTAMKYLILGVTLFISFTLWASLNVGIGQKYKEALGVFGQAPFSTLSPSETFFAFIPRFILSIHYQMLFFPNFYEPYEPFVKFLLTSQLFWVRIFTMIGVLVLAVYVPRGWCRYLCPQGAFSALISRFSFLGLRRNPIRCIKAGCRLCVDACPMMIRILDLPWEKFSDPECIYCLKCIDACPTSYKAEVSLMIQISFSRTRVIN